MAARTFTRQQRLVLDQDRIQLVGIDAKNRPVVEYQHNDGKEDRWALLQSGDPADIAEPVEPVAEPTYRNRIVASEAMRIDAMRRIRDAVELGVNDRNWGTLLDQILADLNAGIVGRTVQ